MCVAQVLFGVFCRLGTVYTGCGTPCKRRDPNNLNGSDHTMFMQAASKDLPENLGANLECRV